MAIGYEKRNKRLHNTKSIFQFGLNFFIEKKKKTTDPATRQRSSMKINVNLLKPMKSNRKQCKPSEIMEIIGKHWKSMEIYENQLKLGKNAKGSK